MMKNPNDPRKARAQEVAPGDAGQDVDRVARVARAKEAYRRLVANRATSNAGSDVNAGGVDSTSGTDDRAYAGANSGSRADDDERPPHWSDRIYRLPKS